MRHGPLNKWISIPWLCQLTWPVKHDQSLITYMVHKTWPVHVSSSSDASWMFHLWDGWLLIQFHSRQVLEEVVVEALGDYGEIQKFVQIEITVIFKSGPPPSGRLRRGGGGRSWGLWINSQILTNWNKGQFSEWSNMCKLLLKYDLLHPFSKPTLKYEFNLLGYS